MPSAESCKASFGGMRGIPESAHAGAHSCKRGQQIVLPRPPQHGIPDVFPRWICRSFWGSCGRTLRGTGLPKTHPRALFRTCLNDLVTSCGLYTTLHRSDVAGPKFGLPVGDPCTGTCCSPQQPSESMISHVHRPPPVLVHERVGPDPIFRGSADLVIRSPSLPQPSVPAVHPSSANSTNEDFVVLEPFVNFSPGEFSDDHTDSRAEKIVKIDFWNTPTKKAPKMRGLFRDFGGIKF